MVKIFTTLWSFLKGLGTKRKWIAGVAVVVIVGGVVYTTLAPKTATDDVPPEEAPSSVSLIPVSEYTQGSANSVNTAGSEVVVRAETAGKIVQVLPVGTRVSQNTTIAQFENASQRAALLQAEGSLEAAEASLAKTQGGPRSEKIAILEAAYESAQSASVTTLLSAYGTVDSAVRDTTDQMFSNPEGNAPTLIFSSSNQQRRTDTANQRVSLNSILDRQSNISTSLSSGSDLEVELATAENEVRQTRVFIDALIASLNEAIATGGVTNANIASYKSAATAARTSLTTSLSAIASTRASLETAKQNREEGITGSENTDVAAAFATVKQAQGAYNAALATYQKSIVRAPVSGTVVSCNASLGDVLSVGSDVCRVKTVSAAVNNQFTLPLSAVKYSPTGAFVFIVTSDSALEAIPVTTGLVTANGLTVVGLLGDEHIVNDVRGLKAGQTVRIK